MENIHRINPTPRDQFGRVAPHDLHLEQSILSAAMASSEALSTILSKVSDPELFYRPKHQAIFKVIQDQFQKGDPVDSMTISLCFKSSASTVTPQDIQDMDPESGFIHAANLEYYLLLLKQFYIQRELIKVMHKNITRSYAPTTDPLDCLNDLDSQIQNLFHEIQHGTGAVSLAGGMREYVLDLVSNDYEPGVASGFGDLDKFTQGWQRGDLIVLAARPGEGKTSLALTFALNAMVPTLFFSLEMSNRQLFARSLSMLSGVGLADIPRVHDRDDRWHTLAHTAEKIDDLLYADECSGGLTPQEFRARALRAKSKHDIGLVVVDYLQLMTVTERALPREQQVAQITRTLKGVAKELDVPVIALSQLNRQVEDRSGPPKLSNLRESGAIEQDADMVLFLHKDQTSQGGFGEVANDCHRIELHIAKHRNGPTGICHLLFDKKKTLFKPFTDRI
ncbi:MAG: replicative DNA helicase [Bacteroidetes bacterium]|nr:replicative DNA helicase [Bacteroidota bacterium]